MRRVLLSDFNNIQKSLDNTIANFENSGKIVVPSDRNCLKIFELNGITVNIKSFGIPNFVNQFVYRFFRKSKAERSFDYANRLVELNVGTPKPIAFYENFNLLLFKKSFYVCEQQESDYTFRDLTLDFDIPDFETILREFTKFTFNLHENQIKFLDHSPGNTLIKKSDSGYEFFLVDLNRMEFGPLDLKSRIKNFERLTTHRSMVEIMSNEYAKLYGADYNMVVDLMWRYTEEFQAKFHRKKRLKNKLFFWRNNV